jgi:8-oxo-dGTP pyrophosphatase MutT (NUDIX family)
MIENPIFSHEEEASEIVCASGVIIFNEDKVLVVEHKDGTILGKGVVGLPSGRSLEIDPRTGVKETDRDTAVRELYEETGVLADSESLMEFEGNIFKRPMGINGSTKMMSWQLFICTNYTNEVLLEETEEVIPGWRKLDEIVSSENLAPNVAEAIYNAKDHLERMKNGE